MISNFGLFFVYLIAILLEVGLPICLAVYLIKKYPNAWIMIVTGVFTYAIAQLIRIPATTGIQTLFSNGTLKTPSATATPWVNALIAGLLAAMIEEGMRWIGYRLTKDYAKPFRSGISLGLGHGGSELLIVGALVAYNLCTVVFYNPGHQLNSGVSMATVQAAMDKIATYWDTSWVVGFMSIFEKFVQFSIQLVLSLLMWRAVTKDAPVWFMAAFVFHIIASGITTLLSGLGWSFWQVEGILFIILLLNILILYWFWGDQGGLDSEPDDEDDEDDDEEEDEDDEEDEEDARTKVIVAKKKSAASMADKMKQKATGKKSAPTKKPADKTKVAKKK
jgi:uncharacterized membrane protein YhfC